MTYIFFLPLMTGWYNIDKPQLVQWFQHPTHMEMSSPGSYWSWEWNSRHQRIWRMGRSVPGMYCLTFTSFWSHLCGRERFHFIIVLPAHFCLYLHFYIVFQIILKAHHGINYADFLELLQFIVNSRIQRTKLQTDTNLNWHYVYDLFSIKTLCLEMKKFKIPATFLDSINNLYLEVTNFFHDNLKKENISSGVD